MSGAEPAPVQGIFGHRTIDGHLRLSSAGHQRLASAGPETFWSVRKYPEVHCRSSAGPETYLACPDAVQGLTSAGTMLGQKLMWFVQSRARDLLGLSKGCPAVSGDQSSRREVHEFNMNSN